MSFIFDHVTYRYQPGTAYEKEALTDVSFSLEDGSFLGIIGQTGSGKSTLISHLDGLLLPTEGTVYFNGQDISDKDFDRKELRTRVGMVFQYPEHQLFETTVFEDVKFGPKNQGLDDKEATIRAYEALELVHFPGDMVEQSPFALSGGQKRRAAIAGVLAMKPEVLILDEPTAGLDPEGRKSLLDTISEMHKRVGNTVVLVSHSMEDVAEYADSILVLNEGHIMAYGDPREVFSHEQELRDVHLAVPEVTSLMKELKSRGIPVNEGAITVEEAAKEIARVLPL